MSDASTRPIEDIQWAMGEWLKCQSLDPFERNLVENLNTAAQQGLPNFLMIKEVLQMQFSAQLFSAIHKARSEGILREWRVNAPA
jgi:hypothetical protein